MAALHLAGHNDAGGNMGQTHGGRGLVDLLTACAGGTVDIHLDVLVPQLDLVVVADLGHDLHCREGGVAAACGVKGRDANQTVDAVLALEEAVGVLALDHDGGALDAGLVAVQVVHHLHLVAVAVRPHVVHAVEHGSPVLGLGAAGSGVEGENGVVGVILPGEQGAQAHGLRLLGEGSKLALQLLQHGVVVFLNGHLAHGVHIVPGRAELFKILFLGLQHLQALLHLLGSLHIVPEALTLAGRLQLLDLFLRRVQLQRPAQHLQRRLQIVQFHLVFFKFKHFNQLLSCHCRTNRHVNKLHCQNNIINKKRHLVNVFFYRLFISIFQCKLFQSRSFCDMIAMYVWTYIGPAYREKENRCLRGD